MAKVTVYEFDYFDVEQGSRQLGKGMLPRASIDAMQQRFPAKDHQAIETSDMEIDQSYLNNTDRYYPKVVITNPTPDSETDITAFIYKHYCADNADMSYYRNPETDIVTITCLTCGFNFSFPQLSDEANLIANVAIDGQTRDLPFQPVRIVLDNQS